MAKSEVFNIDCMQVMLTMPDNAFDLAIVDPEYGRKEHGGKYRGGAVQQANGSSLIVKGPVHKKKAWDNAPASPEYFAELMRVSKHQIIWGCNYYRQNFGPGRIIWDKCNDGSDQSGAEIAYNSQTNRVDVFRFMWRGMMQGKSVIGGHIQQGDKRKNEKIIHPTQKPIPLYKWLLSRYAKSGWSILDTHLGSGSSRIAAYQMGFDFTGFEIDPEYYEAQEKRFQLAIQQQTLF